MMIRLGNGWAMKKEWLSVSELASIMKCTNDTVRRWIRAGILHEQPNRHKFAPIMIHSKEVDLALSAHSMDAKAMEAREKRNRERKLGTLLSIWSEDTKRTQGGKCAICGSPSDNLFIDHCHRTGRVRALLCLRCNSGLGFFDDDPDRLEAASRYIREMKSSSNTKPEYNNRKMLRSF